MPEEEQSRLLLRALLGASMGMIEENLAILRRSAAAGRHLVNNTNDLDTRFLDEFVIRPLNRILEAKVLNIESRHRFPRSEQGDNIAVHYTAMNTIISMLDNFDRNHPTFLRMYDSMNLNDPEEGLYFVRHLNLPEEYQWLRETSLSHAYIASFIVPDHSDGREAQEDDDLMYWLAYGSEGKGCSLRISLPNDRLQRVLYGVEDVERTVAQLALPTILRCLDPLTNTPVPAVRETVNSDNHSCR
ncbi:MAG: hypothetical protein OXC95_10310 [Dehalococcoidia bacterium]|nr:hypothetical protein [Dehalococcoidia bacterium]